MQDIGSLQLASIQEALSVDHFSVTVQECVKGSGSPSLLVNQTFNGASKYAS